jgi:hypothetical protein
LISSNRCVKGSLQTVHIAPLRPSLLLVGNSSNERFQAGSLTCGFWKC